MDKAGTVSPGTRVGVLGWATTIYAGVVGAEAKLEDPQWISLVTSLSRVLDGLLDDKTTPREPIRHTAQVVTRRVIRQVRRDFGLEVVCLPSLMSVRFA